MKKNLSFVALAALSIILLVSCSLGFEPSWMAKNGKTTVSFQVAALDPSVRAVIQGGGYFYIRTIGGPTGEKGPLYGPWPLTTGSAFVTDEIPAGTYTSMAFIYSTDMIPPESPAGLILKGNDEVFTTGTTGPLDTCPLAYELDTLGVTASAKILPNETIKEGVTNTLVMTLVPLTGSSVLDTSTTLPELPATTTLTKKFFKLTNVPLQTPASSYEMKCTLTPTGSVTLGLVAIYTADGVLLKSYPAVGATIETKTYTVDYTGASTFFMYIEYHADAITSFLTPSFEVKQKTIAGALTVNFSGSYPSKKLFFGVYTSSPMGDGGSQFQVPAGLGIMTLDAGGSGSALAYAYGTNVPLYLSPGTTYYLTYFIDTDGSNSSITDVASVTDMLKVMPNYGDMQFSGSVPYTPSAQPYQCTLPTSLTNPNPPYTPYTLSAQTTHIYYVKAGGSLSVTGNSYTNPCTIDTAFTAAAANVTDPQNQIYLLSNDIVTANTIITNEVTVISAGSTPYTLTFSSSTNASPAFSVNGGGQFNLFNVIADATGRTGATTSLVSVSGGQSSFGMVGSTITGSKITVGTGGAVSVFGSTPSTSDTGYFTMNSSTITNCEAVDGGAVYIGQYGYMNFQASTTTISGNTATGNGGGVYVSAFSNLNFSAGATQILIFDNPGITPNVYLEVNGNVNTEITRYVSNAPSGDGTAIGAPCSFATAIDNASVNTIVLLTDITLTSKVTINRAINIVSLDTLPIQAKIIVGPGIGGPLFDVPASPGYLSLARVTITGGTYNATSLIAVADGGSCMLGYGSILQNNTSTGNGGAVNIASGGNFSMNGGTIQNCTAVNGGGIYMLGGNLFLSTGSLVTGNTATTSGYGLYWGAGSTVSVNSNNALTDLSNWTSIGGEPIISSSLVTYVP